MSEDILEDLLDLDVDVTSTAVRKFRHYTLTRMSDCECVSFIRYAVYNAIGIVEESVNSTKKGILHCFPVMNRHSHNNMVFVSPKVETVMDEGVLTIVAVGPSYMYRETFETFKRMNGRYYDLETRQFNKLGKKHLRRFSENFTDRFARVDRRRDD